MSASQENGTRHKDLLIQGEVLYDTHTALYLIQGQHEYEFPGTATLYNPVINGEKTKLFIQPGEEANSPVYHFATELFISPHEEISLTAGLWNEREFQELQHLIPGGEWSLDSAVPAANSSEDHTLTLVNPRGLKVTLTIPSGEGYSDYANRIASQLLADGQFNQTGTFSPRGQLLLNRLAGGQRGNSTITMRTNYQFWRYAPEPDTSWRDLFAWHHADYIQLRSHIMQKLSEGRKAAVGQTTVLDAEAGYTGPSELELNFNDRRLADLRAVQSGKQQAEDRVCALQLAPVTFGNHPLFRELRIALLSDETNTVTITGDMNLQVNSETRISEIEMYKLVRAIRDSNLELPGYMDGQHLTHDDLSTTLLVMPRPIGHPGVTITVPTVMDREYPAAIAKRIAEVVNTRKWIQKQSYPLWKDQDEVRALLGLIAEKRNKRITFSSQPIKDGTDPQVWTSIDYTLHHIQTVINSLAEVKNAPVKNRKVELDVS